MALFDEMLEGGVRPDVVSCTALVAALGADGQWQRAERVVAWMLQVSCCRAFRGSPSEVARAKVISRGGQGR